MSDIKYEDLGTIHFAFEALGELLVIFAVYKFYTHTHTYIRTYCTYATVAEETVLNIRCLKVINLATFGDNITLRLNSTPVLLAERKSLFCHRRSETRDTRSYTDYIDGIRCTQTRDGSRTQGCRQQSSAVADLASHHRKGNSKFASKVIFLINPLFLSA